MVVPVSSVYSGRREGKTSACVSLVSLGNFLGVSFIILFNSSVKMSRVSAMQIALLEAMLMTYVRRNWYGVVGRSFQTFEHQDINGEVACSSLARTLVAIKV